MKTVKRVNKFQKSIRGAGMMELLIALLVMSAGVTGTIKLFTELAKNSKISHYRAQSDFLMNDLIRRMKINGEGAIGECYLKTEKTADISSVGCPSGADLGPNTAKIAEEDIDEWSALLQQYIPNAQFTVTRDSVAKNKFTVQLYWQEYDTGEDRDFQLSDLICSDHLGSKLPKCD